MGQNLRQQIINLLRKEISNAQFDMSLDEIRKNLKTGEINASRDKISAELGALTNEKIIGIRDKGGKKSYYLTELLKKWETGIKRTI